VNKLGESKTVYLSHWRDELEKSYLHEQRRSKGFRLSFSSYYIYLLFLLPSLEG
jgi:hypothetical protein